eukprot:2716570-Rhodomonas_salina.1
MSGGEIRGYGATGCQVVIYVWCYGISGSEIGYGGTRTRVVMRREELEMDAVDAQVVSVAVAVAVSGSGLCLCLSLSLSWMDAVDAQ